MSRAKKLEHRLFTQREKTILRQIAGKQWHLEIFTVYGRLKLYRASRPRGLSAIGSWQSSRPINSKKNVCLFSQNCFLSSTAVLNYVDIIADKVSALV